MLSRASFRQVARSFIASLVLGPLTIIIVTSYASDVFLEWLSFLLLPIQASAILVRLEGCFATIWMRSYGMFVANHTIVIRICLIFGRSCGRISKVVRCFRIPLLKVIDEYILLLLDNRKPAKEYTWHRLYG